MCVIVQFIRLAFHVVGSVTLYTGTGGIVTSFCPSCADQGHVRSKRGRTEFLILFLGAPSFHRCRDGNLGHPGTPGLG